MNRVSQALAEAADCLSHVSDTARLDAELLFAHALGIEREALLLNLPKEVPDGFAELIERRAGGEPVAYLVGRRGFWTIELDVAPGVLVPRPDSETLIEAAVTRFQGEPGPTRILDLGTGSGALLLACLAEWPNANGVGIDRSELALAVARRNAVQLGMQHRSEFRIGDWGEGASGKFDLILCNPPYIAEGAKLGHGVAEYEPAEALFAGPDGLAAYRVIAPQLASLLVPGGLAAFEIGFDQAASAAAIFLDHGWECRVVRDLADRDRALLLEDCR